ncbi:Aldehyde dehydrogenase [Paraliobacillus sp. PM-2]|uniref:aldehyde dehydrogenase n=1 Tax=Paraliobacillus sp. PM-2 TaxID=1462524 RepID=UPI00061C0818|nr:aldehyde dehydrogenase [Paraliobacillus sp. PM-2]CQR48426.1 Aldehyde dehydrogenase [Paraliobacillus sp. PM-2]
MNQLDLIFQNQASFFKQGETRSLSFRLQALTNLKEAIKKYEDNILSAIQQDLNKSAFEGFLTEIGILYEEIDFVKKRLKHWMKPKHVKTAITHIGSKSVIYPEPYGVTLIIAPWNYPFQLAVSPLIGAIAAGNTAIIKPSELTPHTSAVLSQLIEDTYRSDYITALEGDAETSQALLQKPFDYIFFTGSTSVGKIVMEQAAKHLTPVTLELGGKSPAIVHEDANLKLAAKRIAWGKFTNAGQTCVAPDYIYVHDHVKKTFLQELHQAITDLYGEKPLDNQDFPKIVNDKHVNRLQKLIDDGHLMYGGKSDLEKCKIEPTILTEIDWEMPIMKEEIFGPILPIMTYKELPTVIREVSDQPKPLALYLFTESKQTEQQVIDQIPFGGGCINDTIYHLATPYLPFGGVGHSGTGSYHGKASFDTFSHYKSILKQTTKFDLPFRYPGSEKGFRLIKKFFK